MHQKAACDPVIEYRPLARSDLDLVHGWLHEPEIVKWYSGARPSPRAVRRKYEPRIAGTSGTRVFVFSIDGGVAGLCQTYRFDDYLEYAAMIDAQPEWAGLDYFIGEKGFRGLGLAHRVIDGFVRNVVFARWPTVTACLSSTDPANLRSIRALERAGFAFLRDVRTSPREVEHLMLRRRL